MINDRMRCDENEIFLLLTIEIDFFEILLKNVIYEIHHLGDASSIRVWSMGCTMSE